MQVTQDSTFVLDAEFAFYGPMGFDIGAVLGNLFLAYFASDGLQAQGGGDRAGQREWLLRAIEETWGLFETRAREVLAECGVGDAVPAQVFGEGASQRGLRQGRRVKLQKSLDEGSLCVRLWLLNGSARLDTRQSS